ncbi:hypothetical protein NE619_13045 [Anaerovorax odorimutans]|uniref:Uncharacterized protein n=1 Tax=Anaerovorax odorimutans TaxID=109327 RepID=A0ABT1RR32_9FIRM|nr:hypothetical protein [Anaerovorax odorimutans]MCC2864933.1 hypothetical protein [Anaerovorax odorimutans]MCQ4637653.1 hypothetical protein [Anaerovorax odorimutans]
MALTNDDLLAISQLLDTKLDAKIKPLTEDMKNITLLLEQDVLPRLQNIESCYTSTYRRYASGADQLDALQADMDIIKKIVQEHSEKLKEIS